MNSKEIPQFKRKIMKYLISDKDLVWLVDSNAEYPDDLIYRNLFPYNRIPETEQEVMTYITVMVDIPTIYNKNDMLRNVTLRIRIYSHADIMQVKGRDGDRIDEISARIDELLNESMDFGIGYVKLSSNTEHVLDSRHHYREMLFKTDSLNSKREGVTQWTR